MWLTHWFQLQWPVPLQSEQIAIKELIPIALACALWGQYWKGTTVRANYDNDAVVAIVNSGYSQEPFLRHLLRCIFFISAKFDFTLIAAHIPGQDNTLADAISRNNATLFLSLSPQADRTPTQVPQDLINKLLIEKPDWTSNSWTLVSHYFQCSLASSTQRSYASAKRRYSQFCSTYITPLSVDENKLCSFVAYLASTGIAYQTIKCDRILENPPYGIF